MFREAEVLAPSTQLDTNSGLLAPKLVTSDTRLTRFQKEWAGRQRSINSPSSQLPLPTPASYIYAKESLGPAAPGKPYTKTTAGTTTGTCVTFCIGRTAPQFTFSSVTGTPILW